MTSLYHPLPSPYPVDSNQYLSATQSSATFDAQTAHFNAYPPNVFPLLSHQQSASPIHVLQPPATTNSSAASSLPTSHPTTPAQQTFSESIDIGAVARSNSALLPERERLMYARAFNSMGGPVLHNNRGIKRQRDHERTPSNSTIASNGPASPFPQSSAHPQVANTDTSPNSPAYHTEPSFGGKIFPAQSTINAELLNTGYAHDQFGGAHLAMKDFGLDHHFENGYSGDFAPSRHSMSSYGNDSPATPQSGSADVDMQAQTAQANGEPGWDSEPNVTDYLLFDDLDIRQMNPPVQFQRTESQAFKDELYMPPQNYTSTPAFAPQQTPQTHYLSPHNRNLISERLQTANLQRSASPTSAVSRERSPFRDGSPLAPAGRDWNPANPVGSAARMRQQQREATAQAELARQAPPLRREPTKTISPKDALLDYSETDQAPLFQDSIPVGYESHKGGQEQWAANYNVFGGLPMTNQQQTGFRHPVDTGFSGPAFDYQLPQQASEQIQNSAFQTNYQAPPKMNSQFDTPDFPASLPSMETSVSDLGAGLSSQDESGTPATQRPDDTRANTGTYTCTYHGCTQRFDSHNNLKKHKQDVHLPKQRMASASPSLAGSLSPRSSGSPAPSGSGMSSEAILARNSQAGPHKCTRINPSTNKPCNTIFSRPYDLTRHEDTIHNNRKQKVRCQYCREEKTFSRNDALTRHMRVVHPEITEPQGRRRRAD